MTKLIKIHKGSITFMGGDTSFLFFVLISFGIDDVEKSEVDGIQVMWKFNQVSI